MGRVEVKICGVKTPEAVDAAARGGAGYLGFNFYRPSTRYLDPEHAAALARRTPPGMQTVAVTVDGDDALFEAIFRAFTPDFIQLHGRETPARAAALKARWGAPVIRVVAIDDAADFEATAAHEDVADCFLFEARPPKGAIAPGGNAVSFDWRLLDGRRFAKPWFLAGGLNAANLKQAVRASGAARVDLSSGVERAPGEKDPAMIEHLLRAL